MHRAGYVGWVVVDADFEYSIEAVSFGEPGVFSFELDILHPYESVRWAEAWPRVRIGHHVLGHEAHSSFDELEVLATLAGLDLFVENGRARHWGTFATVPTRDARSVMSFYARVSGGEYSGLSDPERYDLSALLGNYSIAGYFSFGLNRSDLISVRSHQNSHEDLFWSKRVDGGVEYGHHRVDAEVFDSAFNEFESWLKRFHNRRD